MTAANAEACAVAAAADIICSLRGADLAGWTPPWGTAAAKGKEVVVEGEMEEEELAWPTVARGKRSRSSRRRSPSGSGSAATKGRWARGSPASPLDYSGGSGSGSAASTSGGEDGAFCSPPPPPPVVTAAAATTPTAAPTPSPAKRVCLVRLTPTLRRGAAAAIHKGRWVPVRLPLPSLQPRAAACRFCPICPFDSSQTSGGNPVISPALILDLTSSIAFVAVGPAGRRQLILPTPTPRPAGQRPRKKMRLPEIQQLVRSLTVENDGLREEMVALQRACTALSKENCKLETRLEKSSKRNGTKSEGQQARPQPDEPAAKQESQNGFVLPDLNLPVEDMAADGSAP
uniref:BZIP domain-containing protein n=1 Tax=Oryza meridionalis TaxID=40149 RepID=A0A0E0E4D4_9ORYZ